MSELTQLMSSMEKLSDTDVAMELELHGDSSGVVTIKYLSENDVVLRIYFGKDSNVTCVEQGLVAASRALDVISGAVD